MHSELVLRVRNAKELALVLDAHGCDYHGPGRGDHKGRTRAAGGLRETAGAGHGRGVVLSAPRLPDGGGVEDKGRGESARVVSVFGVKRDDAR